MNDREQRLARRALPLLATAWTAQLILLILLQASMIPQLGIPAEHFIAREALQCSFMLALCVAFLLTSYTLVVTCRAARVEQRAGASRHVSDARSINAMATLAA